MFHLTADNSLFLFVDFQEKLMPAMSNCEAVVKNSKKAFDFCKLLLALSICLQLSTREGLEI